MDTLRMMVKSILAIIVMATFLEIVLPRNDMKRYINLIIGLFVIIAVLNPFLNLVNSGLEFDVFNSTVNAAPKDTEALISKGRQLASNQKVKAAREYKNKLVKQILAISKLNPGVNVTGVNVEVVEDTKDANFGQLQKIIIHVGKGGAQAKVGQVDKTVQDVQIDDIQIGSENLANKQKNKSKNGYGVNDLKDMLASFYGLTPDLIEIQQ